MYKRPRVSAPPWAAKRVRASQRRHDVLHEALSSDPLRQCGKHLEGQSRDEGPRPVSGPGRGTTPLRAAVIAAPARLRETFDKAREAAESFRLKGQPTSVHRALGAKWSPTTFRLDGPGPRKNLALLQQHAGAGGDVVDLLDRILQGRVGCGIAPSTAATYSSHVGLVLAFCNLVEASPLPADRVTVLRFIALFDNVSTLRGALAAWRHLHTRCHEAWPLEGDPFYSMLHKATKRLMVSRPQRHALRRPQAISLIMFAFAKGVAWIPFCAIVALAYVFGLRVPSELLKQSAPELWQLGTTTIAYGPISRKHRLHPVTLMRNCVCQSHPILCPHVWGRYVRQELPAGRSFSITGARFNVLHRQLQMEMGVADLNVSSMTCNAQGHGHGRLGRTWTRGHAAGWRLEFRRRIRLRIEREGRAKVGGRNVCAPLG